MDVRKFICDICKAEYVSRPGLTKHRNLHCSICQKYCSNKLVLDAHIEWHSDTTNPDLSGNLANYTKLYCPVCGLEFKNSKGRRAHMQTVHMDMYECGVCGVGRVDLKKHMKSHKNNLRCHVCSVKFDAIVNLQHHYLSHIKDTNQNAGKSEPTSLPVDDLKRDVCDRMFRNKGGMRKHRTSHFNQFKCDICSKFFMTEEFLETHKQSHLKDYHSEMCNISFKKGRLHELHMARKHDYKSVEMEIRDSCTMHSKKTTSFSKITNKDTKDSCKITNTDTKDSCKITNTDTKDSCKITNTDTKDSCKITNTDTKDSCKITNTDTMDSKKRPLANSNVSSSDKSKGRTCWNDRYDFTDILKYKCDICKAEYISRPGLTRHRYLHCSICQKYCSNKLVLDAHIEWHSDITKPDESGNLANYIKCYCLICGLEFRTSDGRKQHMETVHIEMYECGVCGIRTINLKRHMELKSHKDNLRCRVCSTKFTAMLDLQQHYLSHIKDKYHKKGTGRNRKHSLPKGDYKCDVCNKIFRNKGGMMQHRASHFKHFKCDICCKLFMTKELLEIHIKLHSDYYHCQICDKHFLCKYRYKNHMVEKHGHKSAIVFTCEVCWKIFATLASLNNHTRSRHGKKRMCPVCGVKVKNLDTHLSTHSTERQFNCSVCSKLFKTSQGLQNHSTIHEDIKPFECSTCNKRFSQPSALHRHSLIHSGKRPYKCTICTMDFNQGNALKRHMLTHKGIRQLECVKCSIIFKTYKEFSQHNKKKHSEKSTQLVRLPSDKTARLPPDKTARLPSDKTAHPKITNKMNIANEEFQEPLNSSKQSAIIRPSNASCNDICSVKTKPQFTATDNDKCSSNGCKPTLSIQNENKNPGADPFIDTNQSNTGVIDEPLSTSIHETYNQKRKHSYTGDQTCLNKVRVEDLNTDRNQFEGNDHSSRMGGGNAMDDVQCIFHQQSSNTTLIGDTTLCINTITNKTTQENHIQIDEYSADDGLKIVSVLNTENKPELKPLTVIPKLEPHSVDLVAQECHFGETNTSECVFKLESDIPHHQEFPNAENNCVDFVTKLEPNVTKDLWLHQNNPNN